MPRWYDKEAEELDDQLSSGELTIAEHNQAMRDLDDSLREEADYAAEQAKHQVYGTFY